MLGMKAYLVCGYCGGIAIIVVVAWLSWHEFAPPVAVSVRVGVCRVAGLVAAARSCSSSQRL